MTTKKPSNHLTYQQRCEIEALLQQHLSLREISRRLDKSPSTISREINKHTIIQESEKTNCEYKSVCKKKHICGSVKCTKMCKNCKLKKCSELCDNFTPAQCDEKTKNINICNGCTLQFKDCGYDKSLYKAVYAEKEYRTTLTESREGFDLTYEQLTHINNIVTPLIRKGQSPYHIVTSCGDKLSVSESTVRRLIHKCELDVRNIDLRGTVQRKVRKSHKTKGEISTQAKIGHLYGDYKEYVSKNDVNVVQMDCVEGSKDSDSVLLTLHFPVFHLQIAIILSNHTADCVIQALDKIEFSLGQKLFADIFPTILTDNGHEFMNIKGMERSVFDESQSRTKIFFCEPNRSDQKGQCECNHKFIRYVIPKGKSMDNYSQADITLMMNHINSLKRKSLYGKTPFEAAHAILPEDFFTFLGLELIPACDVCLNPSLLSK